MRSCIEKRLNKELNNYNNRQYYQLFSNSTHIINFFDSLKLDLYTLDTNIDIEYPLKLIVSQQPKSKIILELKVPKYYPFKPFSIITFNFKKPNNISYYQYISGLNDSKQKIYDTKILKFFFSIQYQIKPRFLSLEERDCFCCHSLTCSQNWNPSLLINQLLIEYLEMKFISQYNQTYSYLQLNNLYEQLFILYFGRLPTEILDNIMSMIH